MSTAFELIRAAAPWAAIVLLAAILIVRGITKKKDEKKDDNYSMEGMCIGMCLGTAIGTALGNNAGIGISLGMLHSLTVGMYIPKKSKSEEQ